ncbi:Peptidase C45, acyl-coenzyme A:6-aminopenicillanic acid acyl-transferase [gut metagenome]|uniref:Peptidase C45, acyl-coenzyme A:6-aminopenicillanic acid acyl-transferase n=1 Tax=gut metagenome TaxID=749906 RepID=J9GYJ9_9ZZZZ
MMKQALLFLLGIFTFLEPSLACTSAVVSGKVTPDGRPLLWKHRDTSFLRNHIAYVQGEKYAFIANVNSDTFPAEREAWMGTNESGFALMNTQSYNLVDVKEGEERGIANGRVIYRALEICATVEDFRHFLDTISKPSLIEANFGVIDANGGAALFEVDDEKYVYYNANDPKDAPFGYIARTNFSFSGKVNVGAGYIRYMETEEILMKASATGGITPELIFNDLSRSFRNPRLGIDLRDGRFNRPQGSGWFLENDFISRQESSCSLIVQGVKTGEKAELTTMWTILGYPPTGIAFPLWVKGAHRQLPSLVDYRSELGTSPMSHAALQRMEQVYSYHQGMGTDRYIHWEKLYSPATGQGYLTLLAPIEAEIFRRTRLFLKEARQQNQLSLDSQKQLYDSLEKFIQENPIHE